MAGDDAVTSAMFASVVDELGLAVLILTGTHLLYSNHAGVHLADRLKAEHGIDLLVLLRDHLDDVGPHLSAGRIVSLVTASNGEPFYVHVAPLGPPSEGMALVTVRELAPDRDAFKRRYRLSEREAQVVDLVLRGYGNRDVASSLGITCATAKKHLTSVFNKVGVDSRSQLISKLA